MCLILVFPLYVWMCVLLHTATNPQVSAKHSDFADGSERIWRGDTADMGWTHALLKNQAIVS